MARTGWTRVNSTPTISSLAFPYGRPADFPWGAYTCLMNVTSITQAAEELLTNAKSDPKGVAVFRLYGGSGLQLRQTMVGIAATKELERHPNPGEATIQVLYGVVNLLWDGGGVGLQQGEWVAAPAGDHSIQGVQDAVVLVTAVGN